ncbi:hypothetical protein HG717_15860 [Rhodococcus erythropolis]|uniref:hypothetical protein n=1 Tax=Rhodococcus erythropolis TaxID=1833 RepID=UPI001C9AC609|nr:hypothetical protein [Rhodococcus erythropolis]MBY6385377.1 hypothetical protein [Rhodococcus erythropolis]
MVDDRSVFIKSNWVVVSQDPVPGITVERATQLKLGIAKPDDEAFDDLLTANQGDEGILRNRLVEQDRQAADARAEEAKERDPCTLLNGVSVDTRLFKSSLQEAKRDIAEPDEAGFKQVTLACANDDEGLVIHAITHPSAQAAIDDAIGNVADHQGFLTNNAFTVERYAPEVGGGGAIVNTEIGVGRLAYAVGEWSVMVEAMFSDEILARLDKIRDTGPTVSDFFGRLRDHGRVVITDGNW